MDQTLVTRIIEAALLAANQPLTLPQLHGLFPLDEPAPAGSVEHALETLREQSASRGVALVEVASGFRYQVQADVHPWVARLWAERQTKYTRATLETLALIAYRQPITRGEIEQIRGVAVNSNIIKALEEREWIRVVGHRDVPGRPELLGTTRGFLDYFGLKRLDDLPPLSELKDFGELDPQLQFEGTVAAIATEPLDHSADMDAGTVPADTDTDTDTDTDADSDSDSNADANADSADTPPDDDDGHHDANAAASTDQQTEPALADDGDSNGATHEQ